MNLLHLFIYFLFLTSSAISYKLEEDKCYFQLYPSEDKDKPYQLHFFNLNSEFCTINSTDGENMNIISTQTRAKTAIKQLSSVIKFNNRFLINTCFGPKTLVEIIDENDGSIYFRTVQNNLMDIEYCYSTVVTNPLMNNDFFIVTYWTEKISSYGKNTYSHKMISFNPSTKAFGDIKYLDTKNNQFYAQSCTTLGNKYIYCTIDPAFSLSKMYHFTIDSIYLFTNNGKINLSTVLARFSNSIYHKPIAFLKEGYTLTGKTAYYFLTEYHDKDSGKTRLMTSVYINYYLMSFILRFDTLGIYYGINIEDTYIDPNLFNHLLPNDELIVIYIMKGAENKNLLLLNRYDYQQSLKVQTSFDKYTLSNYLREDICENPKYMQSAFITSFINYDATEKEKIKANPNDYLKYQKDIGIVISCEKSNGEVFYETKKIVMPQCLNSLFPLNGKDNAFSLTEYNGLKVVLDIKNDPNYKSLKNVEIEFLDSNLYNNKLIVYSKKGESDYQTIAEAITLSNIDELSFQATFNLRRGKTYKIPYRIKQTGFSGISSTCHLTSDLCYFEIKYEGENDLTCPVEYCKECFNNTHCAECDDKIIGIKLNRNQKECSCDEFNGFKKEPNTNINMCVCKDGYSFYQNIYKCVPDFILNGGNYCIIGQDERSKINIYDDVANGYTKYYENGLPYCKSPEYDKCSPEIWFKMGKYAFYSSKVENCVYIIYNHEIILYSNRSECDYKYYDYKNCLNLKISNSAQYYSALNKAYDYSSESSIIFEPDDNKKFYILNQNTSKSYSSIHLSKSCIEKVKEQYNLDTILIFVVAIKNPKTISTQVEYGFYNPNPQFMNIKLNMSICTLKESSTKENAINTNNYIQGRNLQSYFNITTDIDNINLEQDEIIIKVQIDWTNEIMKKIKDLYIERNINIFDPLNPFYNDVCYKFEPPEKTDLYPQDRREIYFIRDALCENNCVQIGYEPENERMICKCKIKENPDNYENVTFLSKNLDDVFGGELTWPNIKAVACIGKLNMKRNGGFYFGFVLIIIYALIIMTWKCLVTDYEMEENDNKIKNKSKNKNRDIKNKKKEKKNIKTILIWEKPMEDLLYMLGKIMSKSEEKVEDIEKEDEDEKDPDTGINKFRTGDKKFSEEVPGGVIPFGGGEGNFGERPQKETGINNPKLTNTTPITINSKIKLKPIGKKEDIDTENKNQNISEPQNQSSQFIGNEPSDQNRVINKPQDENNTTNNKLINTSERVAKKSESIIKIDTNSEKHNRDDYNTDGKESFFARDIDFESKKNNEDKISQVNKVGRNEYDFENEEPSSHINEDLSEEHEEKNNQSEKDSELPKVIPIDSEEDDNKNKIIMENNKKGKKNNKSNPPARNANNNGNVFGPGNESDRNKMKGNNNNKNKTDNENESCLDTFYKAIIYDIKKLSLNDIKKQKEDINKDNIDNSKDPKKEYKISFIYLFLSKFLNNSTLFFIFPWSLFTKSDKDGFFIKSIVAILFIAFYMSFNIITVTKLSTLHLWTSKFEQDTPDAADRFINFFIPFLILYLPVALIKRALSMNWIYYNLKDQIEKLEEDNNDKNKELKKLQELRMRAKVLDTKIKKERNQLETKTKLVLLYGFILLFINLILLTNFCGIYINSFKSLFLNMLSSMLFTIVFTFALQLISTILKYFECFGKCVRTQLSECFSCHYFICCSYLVICKCSFCLCCDCFKEEFYGSEEEENNDNKNNGENDSENNINDNNDIDATQRSNNGNLNKTGQDIVVNQTDNNKGHTYNKINDIKGYYDYKK